MTAFVPPPGYPTAPTGGATVGKTSDAASKDWVRKIVDVVNRILAGKINVVLPITLTASSATTVVVDSRIGPFSGLILQPLTAHAQADFVSATGVLVQANSQINGQVTFAHPNNANADKNFNLIIVG